MGHEKKEKKNKEGKKKSLSNHSQPQHHAYAQFMQERKWKAFKSFGVSGDTMKARREG